MEKRFLLFVALSFGILMANALLPLLWRKPVAQQPVAANNPNDAGDKDKAAGKQPDKKPGADAAQADGKQLPAAAEKPPGDKDAAIQGAVPPDQPAEPKLPQSWVSLGSADPASKYRMLATLTNEGAAIDRIELSSPRFSDLEIRSGYLGYLAENDAPDGRGCLVRVVGAGTAAANAGLKPGDVITALRGTPIATAEALHEALAPTEPNQWVELSVRRGDQVLTLNAQLDRRPLAVIRPEKDHRVVDIIDPGSHDPLSLLFTLAQVGEEKLRDEPKTTQDTKELPGVDLRSATWETVDADEAHVTFRRRVPKYGLEVIKRFRLEQVPDEQRDDAVYPAYHLVVNIEVRNVGEQERQVAYLLDGPTGLPTEGYWYAVKKSPNWGGAGLRDVAISYQTGDKQTFELKSCISIVDGKAAVIQPPDALLTFVAVDAQYFSSALIPVRAANEQTLSDLKVMLAAPADDNPQLKNLSNVTCRLTSERVKLAPGEALKHEYQLFAGPKKPALLAEYGLQQLVYYGWFFWVAQPMLAILQAIYAVVGNYGIAIIALTVLVRACMFPLSRKQALSAQKMQVLQPEIKKIAEKFKNNVEQRTRAQQELFRKHNYHPLGGCLLLFIQLPVMVGLYSALMVNVELRQAPLFGDAIRWCSNLAAPDMFWDWRHFMPESVNRGVGFFGLGPYLNLLPLVTIGLFIWQQKMFMPPATDDQTRMQQKMMKYMAVFTGFLFYKVASGLCLYFIVSSLWGIAERKVLPKVVHQSPSDGKPVAALPASGNGAPPGKKKLRGKR